MSSMMTHKTTKPKSQVLDVATSPVKAKLSKLERDTQDVISKTAFYLESAKSLNKDSGLQRELESDLLTLRQEMRKLRRWRNGSTSCTQSNCDNLLNLLSKTELRLLNCKANTLTQDVVEIDDVTLILDESSTNVRHNMDDDIQILSQKLKSLRLQNEKPVANRDVNAVTLFKECNTLVEELQETVDHL